MTNLREPELTLGDKLLISLRHKGMEVQEMAPIMGVRRETISRWLGDRNLPSKPALMLWAQTTEVPVEWLWAPRGSNPEPTDLGFAADWWLAA
jgi:Predicted transcriptional regulators